MKKAQKNWKITDLTALLVFAIFAICVLAVLLTGADVYKRLTDRGAEEYDRRTATQYITTRVRQADASDNITVENFGGASTLVLREEINGKPYLTRVYCHEGFLRELFAAEDGDFSPEDGEKILEADALLFSLEGSLLYAQITLSDGTARELTLCLRGAEEGQP